MDERVQFVADHRRSLYAMTELCARYGISRKTGYKWLGRYALERARGLLERSHAPHRCPHRIPEPLAGLLRAPQGARIHRFSSMSQISLSSAASVKKSRRPSVANSCRRGMRAGSSSVSNIRGRAPDSGTDQKLEPPDAELA